MNHWQRSMLFGRVVFIYQMPKTGSQTVEATLKASGVRHTLLRMHYLSRAREAEIARGPANNQSPEQWRGVAEAQLRTMRQIRGTLRMRSIFRRCCFPIPKMEVISAVREPIGAALSSIFENHFYFFPSLEAVTPEGCAEIIQRPRMIGSYQNWLDVETRSVLGIDAYERSFPRQEGYVVLENHFARLLLYRFEAMDKLPGALSQFLGCPIVPLVNVNLGTSKPYAKAYADVKKRLMFSEDFVRGQVNSKLMRHFYSPQEREALAIRWSGSNSPAEVPCPTASSAQPVRP